MRPRILVILCVDADPDRPEHGGIRYDCQDKLTWNTLPETAAKITNLRKALLEEFGVRLRLTWFVRSDIQIEKIYGDAAWSLQKFEVIWRDLSRAGDELAWHPHAWRWSSSARCWYNETTDTSYILESYAIGFEAFRKSAGFSPAACRAGINFHNNLTMAKLADLGVKVDLSAHPGLKLSYARPESGCPIKEGFDWSRTPTEPYRPSKDDYQVPSNRKESLNILEVPVTIWRKSRVSLAYWKGLFPIRIRGKFCFGRPTIKGWCIPNVWGNTFRFWLGFEDVLDRAKALGKAHYTSYLHPDDISNVNYRRLIQNLHSMIGAAERENIELDFATASQAYEFLRE